MIVILIQIQIHIRHVQNVQHLLNLIINNIFSEIFKIRVEPNYSYLFTYCYSLTDYINGIFFNELQKQFYLDINRISLQLNNKSVNIKKFIKYVNSLDKELQTIFYLFCCQILYSKTILSILFVL